MCLRADKKKVAVLTGRYDIIHPGHIYTILREAPRWMLLYVYVVDNQNAPYPPRWSKEMIEMCTVHAGNVRVVLDPVHWGYATRENADRLVRETLLDVFLCANKAVARHMRGLGVNVEDIAPTEGYSSSWVKWRVMDVLHGVLL